MSRPLLSPCCLMLVLAWGCATSPRAPVARRIPHSVTVHGETLLDDYAWLRERDNPDTLAYIQAENAYTQARMKPLAGFEARLYQEMVGHMPPEDTSVPYRQGDFLYYSRHEPGRAYALQCRKRIHPEDTEEVLLDLNALAEGQRYFKLKRFQVSEDGEWLAYSVDTTGARDYTLHLQNLRTGAPGPERREHTYGVVWAPDSRTLFYSTENAAKRTDKLWRHVLGEERDSLVYEETDEAFNIQLKRSRSGDYLLIESSSLVTSEVRVLPLGEPTSAPRLVVPREPGHDYHVEHRGELFYIRTNSGGPHYRIVTAPVASPGRENWKDFIPPRDAVALGGMELFSGHLVLLEKEAGLQHLAVWDLSSGAHHRVEQGEQVYELSLDEHQEWASGVLRFQYDSPITPPTTFDYDVRTRQRTRLKQRAVPGYDPSRYTTERLWVTAADGVRVPVSLVYRKDVPRDGSAPLYLQAYGAYGSSTSMDFFSNNLSMLDRGVVVASAHVRGGGELGEAWHDAGRVLHKMNTFTDFISVAEALIARGYTSPERLAIWGGSAGGLLVGAVINLRPELFRVVLTHVPFVDVLTSMLDPAANLTVPDYDEFGDPSRPEEYAAMRRYCPYANVQPRPYPAMLVMTAFNDSQVPYWGPLKWVAKLRANTTASRPLLLHMDLDSGHTVGSDRYAFVRETAYTLAFVLTELGVAP